MEHLAERLAEIPNVEYVTLGGSRAAGTARADSDWDFGLYYRTAIEPADVQALGYEGEVFAPGEWGTVPNGGAWLVIDGTRVDLVYRDLAVVEQWTADARAGQFRVFREVGYVAGVATYSYAAELAINRHLVGTLPRPSFPDALRKQAPPRWRRLRDGALLFARSHAARDDAVACTGSLAIAAMSEAHATLCARGEWYLNDKGLIARAGLDAVQPLLRHAGDDLTATVAAVERALDDRTPGP
jgi:hypothetical protein